MDPITSLTAALTDTRLSRTRKRSTVSHFGQCITDTKVNGVSVGKVVYNPTLDCLQETTDTVHPAWVTYDKAQKRPSPSNAYYRDRFAKLDLGGPFTTRSQRVATVVPTVALDKASGPVRYSVQGIKLPHQPTPSNFPAYPAINESILRVAGTTAIARTKPTNANSDLLVFLGELRHEGIPKILSEVNFKSKIDFFRSLGNDYLRVEFGWKPFLRDIRSLAGSVAKSHDLIQQFKQNSGKDIPVRYTFPDQRSVGSSTVRTSQAGFPAGDVRAYSNLGSIESWSESSSETWFEGVFAYQLATTSGQLGRLIRQKEYANFLLNTRITPSTLWNLTPWSWAADWVLNIGDIANNLSSFGSDGLVLRRGYVMQHSIAVNNFVLSGLEGGTVSPSTLRYLSETKVRRRATPYGFGISTSGFSARQWSILAALGISRGPGSVKYD